MSEKELLRKVRRHLEGLDDRGLDYVLGLLRAFTFVFFESPANPADFSNPAGAEERSFPHPQSG